MGAGWSKNWPAFLRIERPIMKNILVISLGSSPSVVTETIWALNARSPSFWPDVLHLVTTADAHNRGLDSLVEISAEGQTSRGPKLIELCQNLEQPEFGVNLHIPQPDAAEPVSDIKTEADAIAFGDTISELVRQLTEVSDSTLHLSIAGGRKTMSYHAGAALTLYGRAQDELSHILVAPQELEGCRDFWWPTKEKAKAPHTFLRDENGKPRQFSTHVDDAHLTLVITPFFRARPYVPETVLTSQMDYANVVDYANAVMTAKRLIIKPSENIARISDIDLDLSPSEMAIYAVFARYARDGLQALCAGDFNDTAPNGPGEEYRRLRDFNPEYIPRTFENPDSDSKQIDTLLSRLRTRIRALNDDMLIGRYGLSKAERGTSYYKIIAPADEIDLDLGDRPEPDQTG